MEDENEHLCDFRLPKMYQHIHVRQSKKHKNNNLEELEKQQQVTMEPQKPP